jgi:predicted ATP-dependent protease
MRDRCLVPASDVAVRTDPAALPEQPAAIQDRFALLPARVQRALRAGLVSSERSFHVFVATPPEVVIEDDLLAVLDKHACSLEPPDDLAYVHDFDSTSEPRPLVLPAGRGGELAEALSGLTRSLSKALDALGRNDDIRARERALAKDLETRSREAMSGLEGRARELGFGVRHLPGGVQTFPILHGKPVSSEQFTVLDEATRKVMTEAEEMLSVAVDAAAARVRAMTDEIDAARDVALQEGAERIIEQELAPVVAAFADLPDVEAFLDRLRAELSASWRELVDDGDHARQGASVEARGAALARLSVNLLVSHAPGQPPRAPVVFERNPRADRLFGTADRRVEGGLLTADFTRLRPGALIRASGGFLVMRALDLLGDSNVWETLKRALFALENPFEIGAGPLAPLSVPLRPLPAPIAPRVVLIGAEDVYTALCAEDPDFALLFRIKVEVDPDVPRTPTSTAQLDGYLMTLASGRGWLPFDREARARLIDLSTRIARDKEHLSILLPPLEETAAFASEAARDRAAERVGAADIDAAWEDRRDRTSAAARTVRQQVLNGELLIETQSTRVGVVNGLAVVSINDVHFGQPLRITAVVSPGNEGLVDVEREAHLGGAVHTKGVAILRGLLSLLFGQERPLSLRAQITFEQSYGEVDGDSASSSELFAILSALADVGIDQGVAVTGSVNQLGEMQAIGGVCAKIEGFYDLCAARGLTGAQGVMMPRSNIRHLMLRDDVADAIAQGKFHLYAVSNVWQGIEVLVGTPAGVRDEDGRFPAASVFGRVERRLIELAERLRGADHPHNDALDGDAGEEASGGALRRA